VLSTDAHRSVRCDACSSHLLKAQERRFSRATSFCAWFSACLFTLSAIRSLAFCLTPLGIYGDASFFDRSAACSDSGDSQPGVELHRHDCRDGRDVFRGASSAQCFVRSGYGRGLLVLGYRTGLDVLYYSIYLLSPGSIFVSPKTSILTASDTEAKFTEVLYLALQR
jgi:hypothetical protein